MYTQCPKCSTLFRVTRAQLDAADGRVCCGRCSTVFDAHRTLRERLPAGWHERPRPERHHADLPEDFAEAAVEEEPAPSAGSDEAAPVSFTLVDAPAAEGERRSVPEGSEGTTARARRDSAPPPVLWTDIAEAEADDRAARRRPWRALAWGLALLVAAAGLPAQYAYFHFDALAQRAELRPAIAMVCEHLDCPLPPRRATERIELVSRSVRSHPSVDGALLINATVVNRANFAQPYPTVEVTLSDIEERTVATRRFRPHEYLADEDGSDELGPEDRAQLELEVMDPGVHVTNFRFKFL